MKQSIGHGAPSPKLEKVVDIINDHFRKRERFFPRGIQSFADLIAFAQ